MSIPFTDDPVIQRLIQWAEKREDIRAMLLTSSRANPDAKLDIFSDYDVILVVTDVHTYFEDRSYLDDYASVLVVLKNPMEQVDGFDCFGDITHYQDGVKIDYSFFPIEWMHWVVEQPELIPELDLGYVVLLDKDHLTGSIKPPTHKAYIPKPPIEQVYQDMIQQFWNNAAYTAKNLWRDNLILAKYTLDQFMKFHELRQFLEWQVEIAHNWSVRPGAGGKGLKQLVRPDIWAEFECTYIGPEIEENWEALFRTTALFCRVAAEVGQHLGFPYPEDLEHHMMDYLNNIRSLPPKVEERNS